MVLVNNVIVMVVSKTKRIRLKDRSYSLCDLCDLQGQIQDNPFLSSPQKGLTNLSFQGDITCTRTAVEILNPDS